MAFVKLNKRMYALGGRAEGIRMGSHLASERVKRGVYISMAQDVINEVGWTIRQANDKRMSVSVAFNEGTGDDAGFLLLSEDIENGYVLGSERERSQSFVTSISIVRFHHYVLNELPAQARNVEYTIDEKDKTILIQCPDWLRYNSLSVDPPRTATKDDVQEAVNTLRLNRQERRKLAHTVASNMKFPTRK